jgi:hypothetical protein
MTQDEIERLHRLGREEAARRSRIPRSEWQRYEREVIDRDELRQQLTAKTFQGRTDIAIGRPPWARRVLDFILRLFERTS